MPISGISCLHCTEPVGSDYISKRYTAAETGPTEDGYQHSAEDKPLAMDDSHSNDLHQGQIVAARIPEKRRDVAYIYMAEVSVQHI